MTVPYEQNRGHFYKWKEKNPEKWAEYTRTKNQRRKNLTLARKLDRLSWKAVCAEFRNILIDEFKTA